MDHAVAPPDLAWPAGLPRAPAGLRRLRRGALVPVVRHRPGGSGGGEEAGQGGTVLVTPDPSGAAPGGAVPPGESSAGAPAGDPLPRAPSPGPAPAGAGEAGAARGGGVEAGPALAGAVEAGPASAGAVEGGPAPAGPAPAWLTELAADAGRMVVPPRLRAPDRGGRASAVLLLFGGGGGGPRLPVLPRRPPP